MAAADALLPKGHSGGHLSIGLVGKLKTKSHNWRQKAHEHALDQGMAIGFGDFTAAKHLANKQRKREEMAKNPSKVGEAREEDGNLPHDKSYADVSGQTNTEAIMNLLNNCLGAGVLCVPFLVRNCGIATAVVMLGTSAILNRFGLTLILKCMHITDVEASYNGVGRVAFGQAGRLAVVFIFIAMGFGCLVSYVDATADAVGDLLAKADIHITPKWHLQLGMVFILFPPTYIRSLKNVVPISIASFCGALIVVFCVSAQCIQGISIQGRNGDVFKNSDGKPAMAPVDFGTLLKAIPTALTVFSIQAGGSITMSSLKDPSDENKSKVSLIAYIIVFLVNLSVGIPSYLRFGEGTQGNVLESLPADSTLTLIAKICVLDLVVPSYMFMMVPCRVAIIELLFKKNEALMEATCAQFLGVTTVVNLAAVGVALLVSDLSLVIGLVGAIAANSVAFILPCLFFMKGRSNPKVSDVEEVPFGSARNIPYWFLICFSFFSMFSGIYFLLR